jgi:hypothetical protein
VPNRIVSPDKVGLSHGVIAKAVPPIWGIALCALVTLVAVTIQALEVSLLG